MRMRRTDLAVEARALAEESAENLSALAGVAASERTEEGCSVTVIRVLTPEGEAAVGKPRGTYVTLELSACRGGAEGGFARAVRLVGAELSALLPEEKGLILAAGLGNAAMTPDALGPAAVKHILVTRHLLRQEGGAFAALAPLAAVAAEVVGNTGIEAAEQLRALADTLRPAAVLLIDALAARSLDRLCRTVQLSDTGLVPGSGVGNHRRAIDRETLGVPVLSVGVPTVVEGATLALDLLEEAGAGEDALPPLRQGLFVTPRGIDAEIAELSRVIGYGVNAAIHGLSAAQSAALLG